jgi:hypothetical protein
MPKVFLITFVKGKFNTPVIWVTRYY